MYSREGRLTPVSGVMLDEKVMWYWSVLTVDADADGAKDEHGGKALFGLAKNENEALSYISPAGSLA